MLFIIDYYTTRNIKSPEIKVYKIITYWLHKQFKQVGASRYKSNDPISRQKYKTRDEQTWILNKDLLLYTSFVDTKWECFWHSKDWM